MDRLLTLRIRKKSQTEMLIGVIIILPFLWQGISSVFPSLSQISYLIDVMWLWLLILIVKYQRSLAGNIPSAFPVWIGLFFVFTLIVFALNYQSIWYYLWGVRNNFRFYVAFLAFAYFLNTENVEGYLKLFDKLFWINTIVCLFQRFILGFSQDNLGGLFGVRSGSNGHLNIFMVIVVTKAIVYYFNKKESIKECLLKVSAALLIAALAELKFFFIEIAIILALASLVSKFSWRKVLAIILILVGIVLGVSLLEALFPEFAGMFTIEGILANSASEQGYTSSGDLNRLTAIPTIVERFFSHEGSSLIGYGLGNCDYSSAFEFLTTPFFKAHSWMHYMWFSTAFIFLEMGYIGLIFFLGFFVLVFACSEKASRKNRDKKVHCQVAKITSILAVLIAIYNVSLRTESGYMMYFMLALPFVRTSGDGSKEVQVNQ